MAQQFYLAVIKVVLLGGLPAIICSSLLLPTNLESSQVSPYEFNIEIEQFPWQAFVTDGENLCTATIIHTNWVMILRSCMIVDGNGSDIKVHAGGTTLDQVRQVSSAEIYRGNDQPEGGFVLLHLKDSLEFDEHVQPARLPRLDLEVLWFIGITAGFSTQENNIQLMGYETVYNRSLCPSTDFLCTIDEDSPPSAHTAEGLDFMQMVEYEDSYKTYFCFIGGKKQANGTLFEFYYPIVKVVPWLQDAIGLKVVPKPPGSEPDLPSLCGLLQ